MQTNFFMAWCKSFWSISYSFSYRHGQFVIAAVYKECTILLKNILENACAAKCFARCTRSLYPSLITFHQHIRTSHAKITFYHSRRVLNYFSFNYIVHRKYISSVARLAWHNSLSARICMPSLSLPLSLSIILCCHTLHYIKLQCAEHRNASHRIVNWISIRSGKFIICM